MRPDLVTLFTGVNDVTARRFDADAVGRDVEHMQRTLIENGATVIGFTLPDLSLVMPITRLFSGRVRALNDALRRASASSGAILVDVAKHSVGSDPRLWSVDRLHANSAGHERIAAALAWGLGLSGTDDSWSHPLPTPWSRSWAASHTRRAPVAARLLPAVALATRARAFVGRQSRTEAAQPHESRSLT